MKKVAFFVEGQTEAFFIMRLLKELVRQERISISYYEFQGGSPGNPRVSNIKLFVLPTNQEFYISIYSSTRDENVNSDIKDQWDTLAAQGYSLIIGLRDLRGKNPHTGGMRTIADLSLLKSLNRIALSSSPIPVKSIVAVMEIETWFLAETNHYEKIDTRLTPTLIAANAQILGFNPFTENAESVADASGKLNELYELVKKHYKKKEKTCKKTINALDMANIYIELPQNYASLKELIDAIESFL